MDEQICGFFGDLVFFVDLFFIVVDLCGFCGFVDFFWIFWDTPGLLQIFVDLCGFLWVCGFVVDFCGLLNLWLFGSMWICCGLLWILVVFCKFLWIFVGLWSCCGFVVD